MRSIHKLTLKFLSFIFELYRLLTWDVLFPQYRSQETVLAAGNDTTKVVAAAANKENQRNCRSGITPELSNRIAREHGSLAIRSGPMLSPRYPVRHCPKSCYIFCRFIFLSQHSIVPVPMCFPPSYPLYMLWPQPHGTDFKRTQPEKELLSATAPALLDSTPVHPILTLDMNTRFFFFHAQ